MITRDTIDFWTASRIYRRWGRVPSVDIGAGNGQIGRALGAFVAQYPEYNAHRMHQFRADQFELVVCSNVIEHLAFPLLALREFRRIGRKLYLSWTPWHSPWGGHDFAPWHLFGKRKGEVCQVGNNLFPLSSQQTIQMCASAGWSVVDFRPRYWPCFPWLARLPHPVNDFLSWNVEIWATAK